MDIFERRLIFTMGKGGVGKSLISALLARLALQRGKRVLLVQVNTRDRIADYLGCEAATDAIREVMPGLFSVSIEPRAAMKEYVLLQVKLPLIYRLVFENRAVRYFLNAVPALNDLIVLGKIIYHLQQTEKDSDKPLYDLVLVDAPPTGHGLFLVGLPTVMMGAVGSGPIYREAANMQNILADPRLCAINLVTLPEEMPVSETVEMAAKLRRDGLPLGHLFVNQIVPETLGDTDEDRLDKLAGALEPQSEAGRIAAIGRAALKRRRMQAEHLQQLVASLDLPRVELPQLAGERFVAEEMDALTEICERQLKEHDGH